IRPPPPPLPVLFADLPTDHAGEGWKISFKKLFNILLFSLIFSSCLIISLCPFGSLELEHHYPVPSAQTSQGWRPQGWLPRGGRSLTILLWTWPFGSRFNFTECSELLSFPGCRCPFTTDRSHLCQVDAVILHHRDVCGDRERLARLPRLPSQPWIRLNTESPSHSSHLSAMDNLFNLTTSCRRDSDILVPYGELRLLGQPRPVAIPHKSRLVAWVVRNWQEESRRVRYYQELREHIPVDVYGKNHTPLLQEQLLATVSQYTSYLAFENSQHRDYITEKLWRNALCSGTIPVVLGPPRENHERFLPPDSFIHVDGFGSARELARFLLELAWDAGRYRGYFQRRRWFRPVLGTGWARRLCRACCILHATEPPYRAVPDLT
ncbi:FUT6 fucosyltransferase, partial [Machaerirhynchus nigripectus]|nr:FUT6 fucosyltransferase [Machaerirhynchus nigripectus]